MIFAMKYDQDTNIWCVTCALIFWSLTYNIHSDLRFVYWFVTCLLQVFVTCCPWTMSRDLWRPLECLGTWRTSRISGTYSPSELVSLQYKYTWFTPCGAWIFLFSSKFGLHHPWPLMLLIFFFSHVPPHCLSTSPSILPCTCSLLEFVLVLLLFDT